MYSNNVWRHVGVRGRGGSITGRGGDFVILDDLIGAGIEANARRYANNCGNGSHKFL